MVQTREIELSTRGHADTHDLTAGVENLVAESGIRDGLVALFTPSSTSGLTTIEFEDCALEDLRATLDRLVPPRADYRHNLRWGDGNGHAHIRAALVGPSVCIPLRQGRLQLGTWQQIVFIDFDVRPRRRRVIVQILGEAPEPVPEERGKKRKS
jgi:secondary thiamine-phosphate synthase enzyme